MEVLHAKSDKLLDSWGSPQNRWILIRDGRRIERTFTQRLYAASELRFLLLETGFSSVKIYGGWDESPYDHRAAIRITTAQKQEFLMDKSIFV
ncbi:MAG: hypothetical protein LBT93_06840 [Treponema sp.]|nr:hypothetical protein [Treponema sp.]